MKLGGSCVCVGSLLVPLPLFRSPFGGRGKGGVGGDLFLLLFGLADFHSSVGCLAFNQVLLGNLLSALLVAFLVGFPS